MAENPSLMISSQLWKLANTSKQQGNSNNYLSPDWLSDHSVVLTMVLLHNLILFASEEPLVIYVRVQTLFLIDVGLCLSWLHTHLTPRLEKPGFKSTNPFTCLSKLQQETNH